MLDEAAEQPRIQRADLLFGIELDRCDLHVPSRSSTVTIIASLTSAMCWLKRTPISTSRAFAAPTPSPSPSGSTDACSLLDGPSKQYCEGDKSSGGSSTIEPTSSLDPLASLPRILAGDTLRRLAGDVAREAQLGRRLGRFDGLAVVGQQVNNLF